MSSYKFHLLTMPSNPQALFRKAVLKALIDQELTVTALAHKMGYARNTVSIAIHHPTMFPAVRQRIAKTLRVEVPA